MDKIRFWWLEEVLFRVVEPRIIVPSCSRQGDRRRWKRYRPVIGKIIF